MKKPSLIMIALLCVHAGVFAQSYDYQITDYQASFELIQGSPDVLVTLRLTYRVGNTPKSDGFKYVGNALVEKLICTDDEGRLLESEVISERETKLEWRFPAVRQSKQIVVVRFRMRDYLRSNRDYVILDAPWAGVFRVPVKYAIFDLVIPGADKPSVGGTRPSTYRLEQDDGRWRLIFSQSTLREQKFTVRFTSKNFFPTSFKRMEISNNRSLITVIVIVSAIVGFLVFMIVTGAKNAKNKIDEDWTGPRIVEDSKGGKSVGWLGGFLGGGCSGGGCGGGGCGGGGCGG